MKPPTAILAMALKPKGKGMSSASDEESEEMPESKGGGDSAKEYKSLIADSAKAGDWDAFADAVAGLVRCGGGEE